MKGGMIQVDFETLKRLHRYKNENSTAEKRIKIKDLVSKALNQALNDWELDEAEQDDHK